MADEQNEYLAYKRRGGDLPIDEWRAAGKPAKPGDEGEAQPPENNDPPAEEAQEDEGAWLTTKEAGELWGVSTQVALAMFKDTALSLFAEKQGNKWVVSREKAEGFATQDFIHIDGKTYTENQFIPADILDEFFDVDDLTINTWIDTGKLESKQDVGAGGAGDWVLASSLMSFIKSPELPQYVKAHLETLLEDPKSQGFSLPVEPAGAQIGTMGELKADPGLGVVDPIFRTGKKRRGTPDEEQAQLAPGKVGKTESSFEEAERYLFNPEPGLSDAPIPLTMDETLELMGFEKGDKRGTAIVNDLIDNGILSSNKGTKKRDEVTVIYSESLGDYIESTGATTQDEFAATFDEALPNTMGTADFKAMLMTEHGLSSGDAGKVMSSMKSDDTAMKEANRWQFTTEGIGDRVESFVSGKPMGTGDVVVTIGDTEVSLASQDTRDLISSGDITATQPGGPGTSFVIDQESLVTYQAELDESVEFVGDLGEASLLKSIELLGLNDPPTLEADVGTTGFKSYLKATTDMTDKQITTFMEGNRTQPDGPGTRYVYDITDVPGAVDTFLSTAPPVSDTLGSTAFKQKLMDEHGMTSAEANRFMTEQKTSGAAEKVSNKWQYSLDGLGDNTTAFLDSQPIGVGDVTVMIGDTEVGLSSADTHGLMESGDITATQPGGPGTPFVIDPESIDTYQTGLDESVGFLGELADASLMEGIELLGLNDPVVVPDTMGSTAFRQTLIDDHGMTSAQATRYMADMRDQDLVPKVSGKLQWPTANLDTSVSDFMTAETTHSGWGSAGDLAYEVGISTSAISTAEGKGAFNIDENGELDPNVARYNDQGHIEYNLDTASGLYDPYSQQFYRPDMDLPEGFTKGQIRASMRDEETGKYGEWVVREEGKPAVWVSNAAEVKIFEDGFDKLVEAGKILKLPPDRYGKTRYMYPDEPGYTDMPEWLQGKEASPPEEESTPAVDSLLKSDAGGMVDDSLIAGITPEGTGGTPYGLADDPMAGTAPQENANYGRTYDEVVQYYTQKIENGGKYGYSKRKVEGMLKPFLGELQDKDGLMVFPKDFWASEEMNLKTDFGEGNWTPPASNLAELDVTIVDVVDGDTVRLSNGQTVRIVGYDSPEVGDVGWTEAKKITEDYVELFGNKLKVLWDGLTDIYQRPVVRIAQDTDLDGRSVRSGLTEYVSQQPDPAETGVRTDGLGPMEQAKADAAFKQYANAVKEWNPEAIADAKSAIAALGLSTAEMNSRGFTGEGEQATGDLKSFDSFEKTYKTHFFVKQYQRTRNSKDVLGQQQEQEAVNVLAGLGYDDPETMISNIDAKPGQTETLINRLIPFVPNTYVPPEDTELDPNEQWAKLYAPLPADERLTVVDQQKGEGVKPIDDQTNWEAYINAIASNNGKERQRIESEYRKTGVLDLSQRADDDQLLYADPYIAGVKSTSHKETSYVAYNIKDEGHERRIPGMYDPLDRSYLTFNAFPSNTEANQERIAEGDYDIVEELKTSAIGLAITAGISMGIGYGIIKKGIGRVTGIVPTAFPLNLNSLVFKVAGRGLGKAIGATHEYVINPIKTKIEFNSYAKSQEDTVNGIIAKLADGTPLTVDEQTYVVAENTRKNLYGDDVFSKATDGKFNVNQVTADAKKGYIVDAMTGEVRLWTGDELNLDKAATISAKTANGEALTMDEKNFVLNQSDRAKAGQDDIFKLAGDEDIADILAKAKTGNVVLANGEETPWGGRQMELGLFDEAPTAIDDVTPGGGADELIPRVTDADIDANIAELRGFADDITGGTATDEVEGVTRMKADIDALPDRPTIEQMQEIGARYDIEVVSYPDAEGGAKLIVDPQGEHPSKLLIDPDFTTEDGTLRDVFGHELAHDAYDYLPQAEKDKWLRLADGQEHIAREMFSDDVVGLARPVGLDVFPLETAQNVVNRKPDLGNMLDGINAKLAAGSGLNPDELHLLLSTDQMLTNEGLDSVGELGFDIRESIKTARSRTPDIGSNPRARQMGHDFTYEPDLTPDYDHPGISQSEIDAIESIYPTAIDDVTPGENAGAYNEFILKDDARKATAQAGWDNARQNMLPGTMEYENAKQSYLNQLSQDQRDFYLKKESILSKDSSRSFYDNVDINDVNFQVPDSAAIDAQNMSAIDASLNRTGVDDIPTSAVDDVAQKAFAQEVGDTVEWASSKNMVLNNTDDVIEAMVARGSSDEAIALLRASTKVTQIDGILKKIAKGLLGIPDLTDILFALPAVQGGLDAGIGTQEQVDAMNPEKALSEGRLPPGYIALTDSELQLGLDGGIITYSDITEMRANPVLSAGMELMPTPEGGQIVLGPHSGLSSLVGNKWADLRTAVVAQRKVTQDFNADQVEAFDSAQFLDTTIAPEGLIPEGQALTLVNQGFGGDYMEVTQPTEPRPPVTAGYDIQDLVIPLTAGELTAKVEIPPPVIPGLPEKPPMELLDVVPVDDPYQPPEPTFTFDDINIDAAGPVITKPEGPVFTPNTVTGAGLDPAIEGATFTEEPGGLEHLFEYPESFDINLYQDFDKRTSQSPTRAPTSEEDALYSEIITEAERLQSVLGSLPLFKDPKLPTREEMGAALVMEQDLNNRYATETVTPGDTPIYSGETMFPEDSEPKNIDRTKVPGSTPGGMTKLEEPVVDDSPTGETLPAWTKKERTWENLSDVPFTDKDIAAAEVPAPKPGDMLYQGPDMLAQTPDAPPKSPDPGMLYQTPPKPGDMLYQAPDAPPISIAPMGYELPEGTAIVPGETPGAPDMFQLAPGTTFTADDIFDPSRFLGFIETDNGWNLPSGTTSTPGVASNPTTYRMADVPKVTPKAKPVAIPALITPPNFAPGETGLPSGTREWLASQAQLDNMSGVNIPRTFTVPASKTVAHPGTKVATSAPNVAVVPTVTRKTATAPVYPTSSPTGFGEWTPTAAPVVPVVPTPATYKIPQNMNVDTARQLLVAEAKRAVATVTTEDGRVIRVPSWG